jgi:tetratricopeptide (TPR) repeat protein
MAEQSGLSYLTLSEALQDVFVQQRTGVLEVDADEGVERFLFLLGELYLCGTNPLREEMEALLAGPPSGYDDPRFDPHVYLEEGLARIARDLSDRLAEWSSRDARLVEPMDEVPDDLVGPVPTGGLVMNLCARGLRETQLLQRLGGLDSRFRATEETMLRRRIPELDGGEVQLLDRLGHTADVRTLIAESGGRASVVLCHLVRLQAVQLIASDSARDESKSPLSRGLLENISKRVLASLEREPLDLDPAGHRARLGKLFQEYGKQSHFELLGVGASTPASEVHGCYMELARLAHPSHAERLRMRDRGRRLEWLFSRLTEAYLVLSDPDRAAQYRRGLANVPQATASAPRGEARRAERVHLAREHYELAKEQVDEGDYFYAIELLRQATLADPQPDYFALLGRAQLRNPRWVHMAVDSFREAVALRPADEALRRQLAEATESYKRQRADGVEEG